jgi:transmembrane sensor
MMNDRFIKLLTKELSDELTDAEREELTGLLHENREYRELKEILEDYWKRDRAQYAVNATMFKKVLEKINAEEIPSIVPRRRFLPVYRYGAAAVILVVAGLLILRSRRSTGSKKQSIVTTWLNQTTKPTFKSKLTLSDGSVITLNSATALKYPDHWSDSSREVFLNGEAYFDVARDATRPFIIHTSKMNIKVLGTSFNVKSYQNEVSSEATLINGAIEVTLIDRPSDRIILKPKEKLVVQNNIPVKKEAGPAADPSPQDNAGKETRYTVTNLTYFTNKDKTVIETSWVENKLVFSDKDFEQLSGQLERWYGVHIEFMNDRVKEYRFTGLFEKESLPEALDAMRMIEHFNYKIKNSTVYIF